MRQPNEITWPETMPYFDGVTKHSAVDAMPEAPAWLCNMVDNMECDMSKVLFPGADGWEDLSQSERAYCRNKAIESLGYTEWAD